MGKIIYGCIDKARAGKGWAAMKRTGWIMVWWNIALALILAGCGGGATGNGGDDPSADRTSITVVVRDTAGNPLPGFEIFTSPATGSAVTDSTGKATIGDLKEGGYRVTIQKTGYIPFSRVHTVAAAYPLTITLTYVPHISITVRDEKGRLAAGATLTSDSDLPDKVLDQNGKTEYVNAPVMQYSFCVKRNALPDSWFRNMMLISEIELVLESLAPQMAIISPQHNAKISSSRNIRLSGKGTDAEDGALPDSVLVWSSDRSGELGRGSELVVDMISTGYHTITLTGTDSDGKQSEASIVVGIFDYFLDSYFPLPVGGTWGYRVITPEFYVTGNNDNLEYWSIKDLTVSLSADLARKTTMTLDIVRGDEISHCTYVLTDHLQVDGKSLYITETEEDYTEMISSVPSLKMGISTGYAPRYLLFKNFLDLSEEKTWASKSDVNVQWNYTYYGKSSGTYSEWEPVTTYFTLGGEKSMEIDRGSFPAVELTIDNKGISKKWMLAKGLGIIQIKDENYDPLMVSLLHDSSLFSTVGKPSGSGIIKPPRGSTPPRYDLRIDRRNPKDVRKLCALLSSMCVR